MTKHDPDFFEGVYIERPWDTEAVHRILDRIQTHLLVDCDRSVFFSYRVCTRPEEAPRDQA